MSLDRIDRKGRRLSSQEGSRGAPRVAGKDNVAARRYAGVKSPVVQMAPQSSAGHAAPAAVDAGDSPDAVEPASAKTQDVILKAGELLKVELSSQEAVELVVLSQRSGVIFQGIAVSRQVTHLSAGDERVRIQTRPPAGGLQLGPGPSARVMVSVEPPGSAETSLEGGGAAYLNARQHLLLTIFGINPGSLHPTSGLELARALDALEVIARAAGANPAQVPSGAGDHALTTAHSQTGAIEHVSYELASGDVVLRLLTTFDSSSGDLHCNLSFAHL
jgi:hypothetical protein